MGETIRIGDTIESVMQRRLRTLPVLRRDTQHGEIVVLRGNLAIALYGLRVRVDILIRSGKLTRFMWVPQ